MNYERLSKFLHQLFEATGYIHLTFLRMNAGVVLPDDVPEAVFATIDICSEHCRYLTTTWGIEIEILPKVHGRQFKVPWEAVLNISDDDGYSWHNHAAMQLLGDAISVAAAGDHNHLVH